ncbi:MAG: hypothetical protein LCH32_11020 [Bacteroidetes bacterium]|jgi:hypothetical protein|nr:hypothetical protein [Bacteroidota bacterium]
MKTAVRKPEVKGTTYLTKLRIDKKTIIIVRNKESLKRWMSKYPEAIEVI